MKAHFYPDTDSLYIDLSDKPSAETREVSPGIVFDLDETGEVCGIDIDSNASYLLSESALAKDWLLPEEDEAWKDL